MKTALAIAVLLACGATAAQTISSPPGSVLSAAGGRFVFGQMSEYRRDKFLLDTQTGRLWMYVCSIKNKEDQNECSLTVLQPVPYLSGQGEIIGAVPFAIGK